SDGLSALCEVEDQEKTQGVRRGPANASMQHFKDPVPVVDKKRNKRWEFHCRYCSTVRTFPHTVEGPQISFDDEPSLPKLNNLATHVNECKKRGEAEMTAVTEPSANLNLKRSADMMAAYLKRGELNPQVIPSQAGFLRLFAAFVLDESLPWTLGEAPSLHLLFKYLKISFMLPTDSTVRNHLTKIYNDLTTDNASVNDVLVATAGRILETRYGVAYSPDMHIRCIAHVINLVVQAFLHQLDEAEHPDKEDHWAVNGELPIHYDIQADEDIRLMEMEGASDDNDIGDDEKIDDDEIEHVEGQSGLKHVCFKSSYHVFDLTHMLSCVLLYPRLYHPLSGVQNFGVSQSRSTEQTE
ncbi:hypothetical protein F5887DRAFT_882038, partial [Amanita rubescens]